MILWESHAKSQRTSFFFCQMFEMGIRCALCLRNTFKIIILSFTEHEKYVQLCVSLPVRILWRLPQTMHLRARCGDQISKANLRSTPLLDRIDIHIEVPRVDYEKLSGNKLSESSESIRQRVQAARERQRTRFSNNRSSDIITNADIRIGKIRQFCQLQDEGGALTVRLLLTVSKCQSLMRSATSCCA
jgi:hypothetical protein